MIYSRRGAGKSRLIMGVRRGKPAAITAVRVEWIAFDRMSGREKFLSTYYESTARDTMGDGDKNEIKSSFTVKAKAERSRRRPLKGKAFVPRRNYDKAEINSNRRRVAFYFL